MKYIRFHRLGFVLFEEQHNHNEIAKLIGDDVESAGFVNSPKTEANNPIACYGESYSLNKASHELDTPRLHWRLSRF
jgi:hypothetical protein